MILHIKKRLLAMPHTICSMILMTLLINFQQTINSVSSLVIENTLVRQSNGRVVYNILADLDRRNTSHMTQTRGFHGRTVALLFSGERGSDNQVSPQLMQEMLLLLNTAKEFSLIATIKQSRKNIGSIFSFTHSARSKSEMMDDLRLIEVQSAWRKPELRFHYLMESIVNMIATERLAYELADESWHRLTLTISGQHLILFIDCHRIYERMLPVLLKRHIFAQPGLRLWIGQRGLQNSFFKGAMQDVYVVVGANGVLEQCPHLNHGCPTCGEFMSLARTVDALMAQQKVLESRLLLAETRLSAREECDCLRRCIYKGRRYENGDRWKIESCQECRCKNGKVACNRQACPPSKCRNAVTLTGECCPKCLRGCSFKGVFYEHGNNASWINHNHDDEEEEEEAAFTVNNMMQKKCALCDCSDGQMKCREVVQSELCPRLDCVKSQLIQDPKECCPYCKNADHCGRGHDCHVNATCVNLHNRYFCECKPGFRGTGHWCVDVDECSSGNDTGALAHYCGRHSTCLNHEGGYNCTCRPGFKHVSPFECEDRNECEDASNLCHKDADCENTVGSHRCRCKAGYKGDGRQCQPICQRSCLNGGSCGAPNVCHCPSGFNGSRCELDLDECSLGIANCAPQSICVNIPGRYFCRCRMGYTDRGQINHFGKLCVDINECFGEHTCHEKARCVNLEGSFQCQCLSKSLRQKDCQNCIYQPHPQKQIRLRHGSIIRDHHDPCAQCKCEKGVFQCTHPKCDCLKQPLPIYECCPNCYTSSCQHQNGHQVFASGERWIHECEECQCQNGTRECYPLQCPPAPCSNPQHRPGHCCPECPGDNPCADVLSTILMSKELMSGRRHSSSPPQSCLMNGWHPSHNERWLLQKNKCLACRCWDGHVCCAHAEECAFVAVSVVATHFTDTSLMAANISSSVSPSNSTTNTSSSSSFRTNQSNKKDVK